MAALCVPAFDLACLRPPCYACPTNHTPPLLSPSLSPKLTRAHLRDSHSLRILAPRRPTRRGTTAAIPATLARAARLAPGAAATSIAATTPAHPPASSSGWGRGSRHATASRTSTRTGISPPVLSSGRRGAGRMRSGTTSPKRCSHSDVPLYNSLVIIHTKYTGVRQNDCNV